MKKFFILLAVGAVLATIPVWVGAHGEPAGAGADNHTAEEEAEGKTVWEKLQAKELACKDLSAGNFQALGEYYMGQMTGSSHEAMNNLMVQMMGQTGEEQVHIVLGKRLSGCDNSAAFSSQAGGFMPMMNLMAGAGMLGLAPSPRPEGGGNFMTGNFGLMPFGGGWLFMIGWWILLIAGLAALVRWAASQKKAGGSATSVLDILRQRYAKGEINKEEFEAKKRDLAD